MKNEAILNQAIELLKEVNPADLETVEVNHTEYNDSSVGFRVELTFPPKESITEETRFFGEEVIRAEVSD
ncbi:hypothetical protein PD280_06150 [Virgibacillus salarius]|uniref:hypothetical protein n=1 Tax=Virgibacillus salarius TaxID=447199 RepID=UPI0024932B8E|nr:hypothetical protein [Virgibacillus salarius]WBX81300.1 hypothetical protein PD280_06150 [Virgibacillus salarius]